MDFVSFSRSSGCKHLKQIKCVCKAFYEILCQSCYCFDLENKFTGQATREKAVEEEFAAKQFLSVICIIAQNSQAGKGENH